MYLANSLYAGQRRESALQCQQLAEPSPSFPEIPTDSPTPFLLLKYPVAHEQTLESITSTTLDDANKTHSLTHTSKPPNIENQVRNWMLHRILHKMPLDNSTQQVFLLLETTPPALSSCNPCPLPADHLITLVYYNAVRAFVANTLYMGIDPELMCDEILSPFWLGSQPPMHHRLPPDLRPTQLQLVREHHPYIDTFPSATARDNLLLAGNEFDELELWKDVIGIATKCGCNITNSSEMSGVLVWGESWDVRSWEVSEAFARKWTWMLKGCSDLLESTNYWRRRRGENPLVVEI
ncbi:hypothetical protein B7463_g2285, partial [Scytalidium lignicola]